MRLGLKLLLRLLYLPISETKNDNKGPAGNRDGRRRQQRSSAETTLARPPSPSGETAGGDEATRFYMQTGSLQRNPAWI